MTKEKILNGIFILINLLSVILVFTIVDYLIHGLEEVWSVPPHYFINKVPAAFLLAIIGLFLSARIRNVWLKALVTGGFTAVFLQGKYFIQGYPLDFVILFLFIHFAILYPLLVLMFWAYNKYSIGVNYN